MKSSPICGCQKIFAVADLRALLLAQTVFAGLACLAISCWLRSATPDEAKAQCVWALSGLAAGLLLVCWQRHARRLLGLAALAGVLFTMGFTVVAANGFRDLAGFSGLLLGFGTGVLLPALASAYWAMLPRTTQLSGLLLGTALPGVACLGVWLLVDGSPMWTLPPHGYLFAAISGVMTLFLFVIWHREVIEQFIEVLIWSIYRIRGHGPGFGQIPATGPLLVVANHSAWFDPIYLAKILPRRLKPMMISSFYDLPGMRWSMVHIFHAIRVQKSNFRREAPELLQAIAELDRGGCVVIFPEGGMRRKEEAPLRRFGQGIWHILAARPQTPVVVCWIEGNWGSFCSYFNGPPTKNKRFDIWRRIDVAVNTPEITPAAVLEDLKQTRRHFMQECLQTRTFLGLPAFPLPAGLETDDDQDAE